MTTNILIGVVLFLMLGLSVVLQIFRTRQSPLGRVVGILSNVNQNEKYIRNFSYHRSKGKLKAGAWKKNRDKVDFLPEELRLTLSRLFEMVEEVNGRIDAAIKYQSDSYMAGIDVSKLEAPLAKSKEQLQEWIQENMHNPAYLPKKRSLFR